MISKEWTPTERLLLIALESHSLREVNSMTPARALTEAGLERILFLATMPAPFLEANREDFQPLIERVGES
jgi:hypothetical protein